MKGIAPASLAYLEGFLNSKVYFIFKSYFVYFKTLLFIIYVYVCFTSMYVCVPHACSAHGDQKKSVGFELPYKL